MNIYNSGMVTTLSTLRARGTCKDLNKFAVYNVGRGKRVSKNKHRMAGEKITIKEYILKASQADETEII